MSRSIHQTRSGCDRIRRMRFSDPAEQKRRVDEAEAQLDRKWIVKQTVLERRRAPVRPTGPGSPAAIPIHVYDEGLFVHHPASVADLLAVIDRLPQGVLDGLSHINLRLGQDAQPDPPEEGPPYPDPWTGRIGWEGPQGVYSGNSLGRYTRSETRIELFTYVYDADLLPDPMVWTLFMKAQVLATFVHEVAHHDDWMRRTAHGRWDMMNKRRCENYAETQEHKWIHEAVLPYLSETYPGEMVAFERWVATHIGLPLSLGDVMGDLSRDTRQGQPEVFRFELFWVLGNLSDGLTAGADRRSIHFVLARDLRRAERHDLSLRVLDGLLQVDPDDLEVRTSRAAGLVDQERYDEALAEIDSVLRHRPDDEDALSVKVDVLRGQRRWADLVVLTTRLLEAQSDPPLWRTRWLRHRAWANFNLGDPTALTKDVALLEAIEPNLWAERALRWLRAAMTKAVTAAGGQDGEA